MGDINNWDLVPWDEIQAKTLTTSSKEDGSFLFEESVLPSTLGSVLWATHLEGSVAMQLLPSEPANWPDSIALVLSEPQPIVCSVKDTNGAVVVGATVVQLGIRPLPANAGDPTVVLAHRTFRREWGTNDRGQVQGITGLPFTQGLFAAKGQAKAKPWFATSPKAQNVEIVLQPCFEARIRVLGSALPTDLRVVTSFEDRAGGKLIAQRAVRTDGTCAPMMLPVLDVFSYTFALKGKEIVPDEKAVTPPRPGEIIDIELVAAIGHTVRVLVQDSSGVPITGAIVGAIWGNGAATRAVHTTTGPDGRGMVGGCSPESVLLTATKKGYGDGSAGPFLVPTDVQEEIVLTLEPAGKLAGRCIHDGKPVEDFEIVYWRVEGALLPKSERFEDKEDGRFEIEDVPVGSVKIMATTSELPRSIVQQVDVRASESTEVEIELPPAVSGRVQVVDFESRAPLEGATLQMYTNDGRQLMTAWGPPLLSDVRGTIRIPALAPGDNRYIVGAPGYASRILMTIVASQAEHDAGTITLQKTQTFTVRVLGAPEALQGMRVYAVGAAELGPVELPASGEVRFDGVTPGYYTVSVNSTKIERTVRHWLEPGQDWVLEIPLQRGDALRVKAVAPPGQALPTDLLASVWHTGSAGQLNQDSILLDERGEGSFAFAPQGEFVAVVGAGGISLGSVRHSEISGDIVEIPLGVPRLRVRVVDLQRRPLEGAKVDCAPLQPSTFWYDVVLTDKDGYGEFVRPPLEEFALLVHHASHGTHLDRVFRASQAGQEPIELVVDTPAALDVRLVDSTGPQSGIQVRVYNESGTYFVSPFSSDAAGRIRLEGYSKGRLSLVIDQAGYWRETHKVETTLVGNAQDVRIRRLGALRIHVADLLGAAVSGASVQLRHGELDAQVADWISAGRVEGSPGGMVTDGAGVLTIDALPEGTIHWSVKAPAGTERAGQVVLKGGGTTLLSAQL